MYKVFCFTCIFVCLMGINSELEYVVNILQHSVLVIVLSINPQPLSALRLTKGSWVDTLGDNQNSV